MPKTKDAFALRDVAERLNSSFEYLNSPDIDPDVAEIYDREITNDIGNWVGIATHSMRSIVGTKGVEFELRALENDLDRLQKKIKRVDAHIYRLQKYLESIVDRLISGNDDKALRERASRAKGFYSLYERIRNELMINVDTTEESIMDSRARLPVEFKKDFGYRLKLAREHKNISLKSVAQELDLTYTGYVQYERGLREPPLWTIKRLAELYNVSTDWLFGLKN